MVVRVLRSQHGRLRASVGAAEWPFSDRLPRDICNDGEWNLVLFALHALCGRSSPTDPPSQPRIEGKVEIRPSVGVTAPVHVSLITVSLHRRETIHPSADSMTKKRLAPPRKEITDTVGKEMLLFRCPAGREIEEVISMDLPFVLFIPFGRGGPAEITREHKKNSVIALKRHTCHTTLSEESGRG